MNKPASKTPSSHQASRRTLGGAVFAAAALLTGCSFMRGVETALAPEGSWAPSQLQANVQGAVWFDEKESSFALFNHGARAGAGPQEKAYRTIVFSLVTRMAAGRSADSQG